MKKHAGLLFVLCLLLTFGAAKAQGPIGYSLTNTAIPSADLDVEYDSGYLQTGDHYVDFSNYGHTSSINLTFENNSTVHGGTIHVKVLDGSGNTIYDQSQYIPAAGGSLSPDMYFADVPTLTNYGGYYWGTWIEISVD